MSLVRSRYRRSGVVALLAAVAGCAVAPDRAPWREGDRVIQPMGDAGKESGSLVVETVLFGTELGNDLRRPFFLYDESGRYRTHFHNHLVDPVPLPAGRYVVVTSILNTNKRVQVLIQEGRTTYVRLSDFKSAPEAE
jgi:hypothetical protein